MRSVNLRKEMDAALKENVAAKEANEAKEKAKPPEFSAAQVAKTRARGDHPPPPGRARAPDERENRQAPRATRGGEAKVATASLGLRRFAGSGRVAVFEVRRNSTHTTRALPDEPTRRLRATPGCPRGRPPPFVFLQLQMMVMLPPLSEICSRKMSDTATAYVPETAPNGS